MELKSGFLFNVFAFKMSHHSKYDSQEVGAKCSTADQPSPAKMTPKKRPDTRQISLTSISTPKKGSCGTHTTPLTPSPTPLKPSRTSGILTCEGNGEEIGEESPPKIQKGGWTHTSKAYSLGSEELDEKNPWVVSRSIGEYVPFPISKYLLLYFYEKRTDEGKTDLNRKKIPTSRT